MSKYYVLRGKYTSKYLSVIPPKSQSKIICFNNVDTAMKCKTYLCYYKSQYGTWPNFDMNINAKHIKENRKYKSKEFIHKAIEIDTLDETSLFNKSKSAQVGILFCTKFDLHMNKQLNQHTLEISGQEYQPEDDKILYINRLNHILNNFS